MGHHAAGLVGENVAVVLAADADHRSGTEIGLLDIVVGVSFQIFRKLTDQVFAFDFHKKTSFYGEVYHK